MLRRKTAHFRETADQKNTRRSLYLVDPDGTLFRMSKAGRRVGTVIVGERLRHLRDKHDWRLGMPSKVAASEKPFSRFISAMARRSVFPTPI